MFLYFKTFGNSFIQCNSTSQNVKYLTKTHHPSLMVRTSVSPAISTIYHLLYLQYILNIYQKFTICCACNRPVTPFCPP